MSPNFRVDLWKSGIPSVGLHRYSGRLYLTTRDGNGWRGSGQLQELVALFTGVLQSTRFYFGNAVPAICYE